MPRSGPEPEDRDRLNWPPDQLGSFVLVAGADCWSACVGVVAVAVRGGSQLNRFSPVNMGKVARERPAMPSVFLIGVVVAVLPSALTAAWLMWRSGAFDYAHGSAAADARALRKPAPTISPQEPSPVMIGTVPLIGARKY